MMNRLPDGRSYVDTIGTKRFKILDRWIQDGYMCGKVQIFSDDNIETDKVRAQQIADKV